MLVLVLVLVLDRGSFLVFVEGPNDALPVEAARCIIANSSGPSSLSTSFTSIDTMRSSIALPD